MAASTGRAWGQAAKPRKGFQKQGTSNPSNPLRRRKKHTEKELLDFPIGVKGDLNKSLLKE